MRHNIISFSFVLLWKQPINIPLLDNKFCKDFFDDPYNTEVGFVQEGFLISLTNSQIMPHILLGPKKAAFMSSNLEQVKLSIEKISAELKRINTEPLEISAIGVNTEYEFLEMKETVQQYLAERFLVSGFKNENNFPVNMTDLRFQVKTDENNLYNLLIQPRANQPNGLYLNINAHRQQSFDGIPSREDLDKIYDQTNDELSKLIFPSLGLEG